MDKVLQPTITFSSIYGSNFIFVARSSPNADRWLPKGDIALDMLTANMLTILGDMSVVCAASVSTPDCLGLLRDAGFQLPSDIHRYADVAKYMALIRKICAAGRKIVAQHVHPENEIPPECSWIAPSVLSFVNNKANLEKLVPSSNIPSRNILPAKQLAHADRAWRLPVVIKAVTDESTGGGVDVRICRIVADIQKAASYFMDCRYVVVEEYLNIRRNLCLSYCVTTEGEITYLGFAEQVSDEQGIYRGNWIEDKAECPVEAIETCMDIVRAAFDRGYNGVLGIDVAVLEDGQCMVFDLNFRGNGSTPAVLYADSIRNHCRKPVMRLRRLTGRGNYKAMLDIVYRAMAEGVLLPLGSCDPDAVPYRNERPLLTGLILGETRQEVLEKERELISMGLDI